MLLYWKPVADKIMDEQHSTGSMDNADLSLTAKKLTFER